MSVCLAPQQSTRAITAAARAPYFMQASWLCTQITGEGVFEIEHHGGDYMPDIMQIAFSNSFSLMKIFVFLLTFQWDVFPNVQ